MVCPMIGREKWRKCTSCVREHHIIILSEGNLSWISETGEELG
uniref:Uncharacterized protein n=1 Tax=Rhizophora mucronata TaxID=61149 RepID=A0A2P2Q2I6_RHIMU